MERILIFGIDGFLGYHLSKKLDKSFEIYGYVRSKNKLFRLIENETILFDESENLITIFEKVKPHHVINVITTYSSKSSSVMYNSNVVLPLKIYENCCEYGVLSFLNTDSFFNNPEFKYSYLSDYTLSKKHLIEWLKLFNKEPTKVFNLKIFHMYGPKDSQNKFIPSILEKLKSHKQIDLTYGKQMRDFIHVDDVCEAYISVIKNRNRYSNYQNFEVGTGTLTSIYDLVNSMKKITRSKSKLNFGKIEYREGEIWSSSASTHELNKIGWKKSIELNEGLSTLI